MEYFDTILPIVEDAGRLLMDNISVVHPITTKETFRQLSVPIEKSCEEQIIRHLRKIYPQHGIISEESAYCIQNFKKYTWILDPLDGTISYTRGIDDFTIAIALLESGSPIFSLIYHPAKNDVYAASRGQGSFLNGKRLTVSKVSDLTHALVTISHSFLRNFNKSQIVAQLLNDSLRIRSLDGSSLEMCNLASGKIDIYISHKQRIYDICPGALLIIEAGGEIYGDNLQRLQIFDTLEFGNIIALNAGLSDLVIHGKMGELLWLITH